MGSYQSIPVEAKPTETQNPVVETQVQNETIYDNIWIISIDNKNLYFTNDKSNITDMINHVYRQWSMQNLSHDKNFELEEIIVEDDSFVEKRIHINETNLNNFSINHKSLVSEIVVEKVQKWTKKAQEKDSEESCEDSHED